jgi:hypothetical protein
MSEPDAESSWPTAIVSRYEAFPALMFKLGYAQIGTPCFREAHPEEVRGMHVLCESINLEMAAFAASVTVVPLELPEEVDTVRASVELLARFAKAPQTYVVRGSSTVAATQFNGGVTPLATLIAQQIMAEYGVVEKEDGELAAKIDKGVWDERRAGAYSERILLKMLAAERDRRTILEAQIALPQHGAGKGSAWQISPPPSVSPSSQPPDPQR